MGNYGTMTEILRVRVQPDLKAHIEVTAARLGVRPSDLVRVILAKHLDAQGQYPTAPALAGTARPEPGAEVRP